MNFTIPHDQMNRLLDYVVHRADCDLVVYRMDARSCTCGLSQALSPFAQAEYASDLPRTERVLLNHNIYGGRTIPAWLTKLVTIKFRPLDHKNAYQPSMMSDG